ncbi:glycosyltransferase [Waterburya agarophytonicola K14]|uniref:Glycosyltransferase n=1 Tax=Waterburya agarophytonicola KI4 TaxID=2874699 RepID=A0A964BQ64_9CYAN|nr:glycosyltransferase [Waterburya agarophytonicola]MCC0176453.1 glycosyltransferase [Waterburya agarophytonicola KI4]
MDSRPLVSIIINNYNYAEFLDEAIASALQQSYTNIELILVDDGSTDDSRQIIASYGDLLIPVFQENGGQASAFNAGFAASQGDIICLLDSDDVFLSHKIAEIIAVFNNNTDLGWCFHSVSLVDKRTGNFLGVSEEEGSRECDFREKMKQGKLSFLAPPTSGLCFRRSLLQEILPMTETLRRGADRYLVAIAPALSKGFYLDRKLTIQGIHQNNGNTLQEGKKFARRRAYKAMTVAYFMRLKLPEFYKITDRIFARGLGIYINLILKTGQQHPEEKELITKYLSLSNILTKIKIYSMAFYQYRPWKKDNSLVQYEKKIKQLKC